MRLARSLLALAVVVGAFGAPSTVPLSAAATDSATVTTAAAPAIGESIARAALDVIVVPAASGILLPGQDLALTVTLANRSTATIPPGTARITLDRDAVGDRNDLAAWLAPVAVSPESDASSGAADTDPAVGEVLLQIPTPELSAGDTAELPVISIPASVVALDTAQFGARKLEVSIAAGTVTGGARSVVTVNPGTGFVPTRLAIAMPLTVPASSTGLLSAELLETYTAIDGLLTRQLDQAYGAPIAIGIDPRIIASIRLLGNVAPESALDWLDRLRTAPNETFPLAYADSDIAATSQAGGGVLVPTSFDIDPALFPEDTGTGTSDDSEDPAPTFSPTASPSPGSTPPGSTPPGSSSPGSSDDSPGEPGVSPVPTLENLLDWDYTLSGIAWPRDSTVVAADLDTFAAAGLSTTILASGNSSIGALETSPGAAATIGEHSILSSNDLTSARLREAVRAPDDVAWQSEMVKLTATLATVAAENPADPRILLGTLDRDSSLGGFQLAQTLAALGSLPWAPTSATAFADALDQAPVEATLIDRPVSAERIVNLQSLFASEIAAARFATVLADPTIITGERRLSVLALASQAWTVDEAGWPVAVAEYVAQTNAILSSVQIVESSTINLFADNGELPIPLSNSLDFPVTVYVSVQPTTAILDVKEQRVEVTIEPNSQTRASIPVESIANGEVLIAVSLSSASGVVIAQPTLTNMTVNAGWETAATTVLAVLVIIVFILGIIRTIRRRRRSLARHDGPSSRTADDAAPVGPEKHDQ